MHAFRARYSYFRILIPLNSSLEEPQFQLKLDRQPLYIGPAQSCYDSPCSTPNAPLELSQRTTSGPSSRNLSSA
jgi:hypothetical protein